MTGMFWLTAEPEKRERGELNVESGSLLLRDGYLIDPMEIVERTASSVAYQPRSLIGLEFTVHGLLDDGVEVTIPHVTMGTTGETQELSFLQVLEGAHTDGATLYRTAALQLGRPHGDWMRYPMFSGPLIVPSLGQITLTAGDGIEFSDLPDLTQSSVERLLVQPLLNFLALVSGQMPQVLEFQLRPADDGITQTPLHTIRRKRSPDFAPNTSGALPLFSVGLLDIDGLSAWYNADAKLTPVCSIINKTIIIDAYDVELKVLNLAASAEAVHRGLYDSKRMSRSQEKKVKRAALDGVPEPFQSLVGVLLAGLRNLSYSERLNELLDRIGHLADGVAGDRVGSSGDTEAGRDLWVKTVTAHRNTFVHQKRNSPAELRDYAGQAYVLYESLRWLLSLVLLCHAGLNPSDIQQDLDRSSSYGLFRKRAELSWPDIYRPLPHAK